MRARARRTLPAELCSRREHGGALHAERGHTTWIDTVKEHAMDHDARPCSSDNGHGAVDRDRRREEIHHLETSLRYWQARLHHTPGSSDPGTLRHQIQHTIDLLRQELGLKRALEMP
jgi:hypothetical protein